MAYDIEIIKRVFARYGVEDEIREGRCRECGATGIVAPWPSYDPAIADAEKALGYPELTWLCPNEWGRTACDDCAE